MIAYILLYVAVILAAVWDIRKQIIPDTVHILLLVSGFILIFVYGQPWKLRLLGFVLTIIVMLTVGLITDGLGGGDIKMAASLVFAIGLFTGLHSLVIAFLLALIYAKLHKPVNAAVPLAPFLAVGCTAIFIIQRAAHVLTIYL